jgi:transcriptional regulator of NAD metabolism
MVVININSKERRKYIIELLLKSNEPQKGQQLAEKLGVTRQVIVKDIAILRAEGNEIIATPEGYMISKDTKNGTTRVIAVSHKKDEIYDELKSIIKYGGIVKDVIIEHPLYGEMRGMLMIKTLFDIQSFTDKLNSYNAEPLLRLTKGIHLHTIEAENEEIIKKIIDELDYKGFLIKDN